MELIAKWDKNKIDEAWSKIYKDSITFMIVNPNGVNCRYTVMARKRKQTK